MDEDQVMQALEYLIEVAKRDTGQSRKCADFLLAWYNAPAWGGFSFDDLWPLDHQIRESMLMVISFIAENTGVYPNNLGYGEDMAQIIEVWRHGDRR